MRNTLIAAAFVGLIALSPLAALADHRGGYSRGDYSRGSFYRGGYSSYDHGDRGYRSHSSFNFSLGLGFLFGGGTRYYDDCPRYYAPRYDDCAPRVVYRAPVVVEEPRVVYVDPPVYYSPPVVYRSYDSGYCYPSRYSYSETRYYYGR